MKPGLYLIIYDIICHNLKIWLKIVIIQYHCVLKCLCITSGVLILYNLYYRVMFCCCCFFLGGGEGGAIVHFVSKLWFYFLTTMVCIFIFLCGGYGLLQDHTCVENIQTYYCAFFIVFPHILSWMSISIAIYTYFSVPLSVSTHISILTFRYDHIHIMHL